MHPIDRLLSIFTPDQCLGCGKEGKIVCFDCSDNISLQPSVCYACGKVSRNYMTCPACRGRYKPQHVWVGAIYRDTAKEVVGAAKFEAQRSATKFMADFICNDLPFFAEPPLVTFVPTAPSRRRERGYDQAEFIAKEISKTRGWNYQRSFYRISGVRQVGAKRDLRKKQLQGAFRLSNPDWIKGKHILIIDDVVTTGATLEECAGLLKKAGAGLIDAAVFARTAR